MESLKMEYIKLLCLFSVFAIDTQATTHWMVTESGLIQPKLDSPFEMARPYDLLAFLNQDTRWDTINTYYHDLANRQKVIDKLWEFLQKNTDITGLLSIDDDCVNAGPLNVLDWYTTFMDDGRSKDIPAEEFMLYQLDYKSTDIPDCKKISSLTFSMFSFDHLEGVIQKENLTIVPELALPERISPLMTLDQFGHWVAGILKKNSSSWLHYNMASLYWRVRGKAAKAIECSRRAIHYAPREYKAVALQSLGSILHRGKKTEDAIIVLGAAVDHDPSQPETHFVLATAYAVYGDFNSSLKHLDLSLKLNPTFELARIHKHGVLCHSHLMDTIQEVHKSLQKLRLELREYSIREAHWLRTQAAFLRIMKHAEVFDYKNVEKNCIKMTELTGLNIKTVKKDGDKNSLIQYFLDSPTYKEKWAKDKGVHAIESAFSFQRFIRHISKHSNMVTDMVLNDQLRVTESHPELKPKLSFPDFDDEIPKATEINEEAENESQQNQKATFNVNHNDILKFATGMVLFPSTMKVSRNTLDFDKDPEWPSDKLCTESAPSFPDNVESIFPAFLPFENKGIRLQSLLTDKIGVPVEAEHELPWHPPNCPHNKDAAAFTQKKSQKPQYATEVAATDHLRHKLLEYVADGRMELADHMQPAEIGQRIYAAMQKDLAPKWLLYTLSSLYWRVRGNNVNALHCLLTASRTVEAHYKDIVLASLASVYLEMGYFDDALGVAEEAFKLSLYEPTTNFILAELNMLKQHRNTQMFHLKQVVRVQPTFMDGLARNLLNGWACILKQVNSLPSFQFEEGDVCTHVEPEMVCDKDGTNCHMSNIQCFSNHERTGDKSRKKELKDDDLDAVTPNDLDDSIFDPFINNMPLDRNNKLAHQKNFAAMSKMLDNALKGCGSNGCANVRAEHLSLKNEDCMYQHLQLGYWLHIISLRQLLAESEKSLSAEISAISPSSKKIPECKSTERSDDFFLERMNRVDIDDWEPILSLMHQFAEMFQYYDYVTLGAKIAKYVDTKPGSWGGLVAAGWWCGAGGRGACARRCLAAARREQPTKQPHALTALAALLHMQSKLSDAKDISYLAFYVSPKTKLEAFLVAISNTYMDEYEQAVWMYRYALTFDDQFLPAKACLHATMCLMIFGDNAKMRPLET